jgi:hypothetical protein
MFLAAAAALSLGLSAAYADGLNGSQAANSFLTQLPSVVAQAHVPNASLNAQSSRGPWLSPPIGKYLDQGIGG